MAQDSVQLPLRKTANGEQIDTRPLYIEEWLDSLPYIDFSKTSRILCEATKATNQVVLKPAVRLELLELYSRPYQYYIDSQIKTGAQHTLQSIEVMQKQIDVLKRIAVNLGHAAKLSAEETLKKKSLWGQTKPPLEALLFSMNYLSHALILSFLEYAPTPKGVWRELHFIYSFAESLNKENTTLSLPASETRYQITSIAGAYKKIIMASLADPYHLPFGAIWEIFGQLYSWTDHINIQTFNTVEDPACRFVLDLENDNAPLPYLKFNVKQATPEHRLIDTSALGHVIQTQLKSLAKGQSKSMQLSPHYAKLILEHMNKTWGLPSKRDFPREEQKGVLNLVCGLNAIYYFLNNRKEFDPSQSTNEDEIISSEDALSNTSPGLTSNVNYPAERWALVDTSPNGIAVHKDARPDAGFRIGDLIAICVDDPEQTNADDWTIGVTRWQMIQQGKSYKAGIQVVTQKVIPVAIRALSGSALDQQFRRALLIIETNRSIITDKGLFIEKRELELLVDGKKERIVAKQLQDTTISFENFSISS